MEWLGGVYAELEILALELIRYKILTTSRQKQIDPQLPHRVIGLDAGDRRTREY
jgi:hypothetical protein